MSEDRAPAEAARLGIDWPYLVATSYRRLTGRNLAGSTGDETPEAVAAALAAASVPVLAHGLEPEPILHYVNPACARRFATTPDALLGLPSSATTLPDDRPQRTAAFEMVRRRGWVDDYSGIRVDRNSRRFEIVQGTIWEVRDDAGVRVGDAAVLEVTADIDDA